MKQKALAEQKPTCIACKKSRPFAYSRQSMTKLGQLQSHVLRGLILSLCMLVGSPRILSAASAELLPPGFRPIPPGVHALVGAPGVRQTGIGPEGATIIIRDGFIQTVATNATPPPDARIWDLRGLTVYAGFIDPYLSLAFKSGSKPEKVDFGLTAGGGVKFFGVSPQEREPEGTPGPGYEVAQVTPERRMARTFQPDPKALEKLRELGFTTANIVPDKGIVRGVGAFVALSDAELRPGHHQTRAVSTRRF